MSKRSIEKPTQKRIFKEDSTPPSKRRRTAESRFEKCSTCLDLADIFGIPSVPAFQEHNRGEEECLKHSVGYCVENMSRCFLICMLYIFDIAVIDALACNMIHQKIPDCLHHLDFELISTIPIDRLIESGADINCKSRGSTLMMRLSQTGNHSLLNGILKHSPDLNALDASGQTAMHLARDPQTARLLYHAGMKQFTPKHAMEFPRPIHDALMDERWKDIRTSFPGKYKCLGLPSDIITYVIMPFIKS